MNFKRALSLVLLLCLVLSAFTLPTFSAADNSVAEVAADIPVAETAAEIALAETGATNMYGLVSDVQDGQILQCWNWSFNNIKNNMQKIASQGFSAIQTSPIQPIKEPTTEYYNTVMNSSWVVYQPVAFNIEDNYRNVFGTKTEFEAMCEEAHKYGVKVIVDTIFNHMANDMSGNTIHPWIPSDIKDNSDCWHDVSKNIYNFDNRYDCTHYCLTGLPDLNTANSTVQWHCTNFLKESIEAGADGFRFDAVKHIETPWDADGTKSDFWPNVLGAGTAFAQETRGFTPYYYGECLGAPGGGLSIEAYTQYMSVTDTGANDIRQAVCDGNAAGAARSSIGIGSAPSKTVQWTESHDNYKDDGTRFISDHNINKTWAMVGARNEVCGLYLARPENIDTTMMGDADLTSWTSTEVRAINRFKNHFVGQSEYMSSYNSLACIERGTSGMIIVNTGGTYYDGISVPVHTMASGTYKDAITGDTLTVSNGYIKGDIGDTGIAVIYNVDEAGPYTKGQATDISVVGEFNNWNASANYMTAINSNEVSTSMIIPAGTYTFKIKGGDVWYGNAGNVIDDTDGYYWTMEAIKGNCTLTASGGRYTFTFNTSTQKLKIDYSTDTSSGFFLKGSFNNWTETNPLVQSGTSSILTTTAEIPAGSYTFKVQDSKNSIWYGNSGTISDDTDGYYWSMDPAKGNCTLNASGGTYTFSFDTSINEIRVDYESGEVTTPSTTPDLTSGYSLRGTFNDWSGTANVMNYTESGSTMVTTTITLDAGTYTFKVRDSANDKWYGNNSTITDTTGSGGWSMSSSANDCTINASGGVYEFTFDTSTKRLYVTYTPAETDPVEKFTVTFTDFDGTILSTQSVAKGESATAPATPTRAADAQYTYTFKEWDKSFTNITADTTVTATYTQTINKYTVTFKDYDGTVLSTQSIEYGKAATAPDAPTRAADAQYTYTFKAWDKSFTNITADTTVTATYTQTLNKYTVTFKDHDGTVLSTQSIEYGKAATAPDDPTREGYTFIGWDTDFDSIIGDTTVTALYSDDTVYLLGTFNDWKYTNPLVATGSDSNTVSVTLQLEAGTYTFKMFHNDTWYGNNGTITDTTTTTSSKGWKMETGKNNCTLSASGGTYTFNYNKSTKYLIILYTAPQYTVVFKDYDGTVLSTQSVAKGESATAPADPTRAADAQYTYTFKAWDKSFTNITADTTVTATYTQTLNKYTVTFKDYDGTTLKAQSVEYGKAATAPDDPTREGYTFAGWEGDYSSIKSDTTITATYTKNASPDTTTKGTLKVEIAGGTNFKISFNDSAARTQGASYYNTSAPVGAKVTVTALTTSFSEFVAWVNPSNGTILSESLTYTFYTSGNDLIRAMYKTDITGIQMVTFMHDKASQQLDVQYYSSSDTIVFPSVAPQMLGYEFKGWNMTEAEIQAEIAKGNDVTVLPIWEKVLTYVDVTVSGGTADGTQSDKGQFLLGEAVTVNANAPAPGKKFAYWTDASGNVKSYNESYTFFLTGPTELTAVFVGENEEIDYQVLVSVDNFTPGDYGTFTVTWFVPDKYEFVGGGIIAVNKDNYNEATFVHGSTDTNVWDRTGSTTLADNTFNWTGPVYSGQTWYAKCWAQYKDESGTVQTVYSDMFTAVKD